MVRYYNQEHCRKMMSVMDFQMKHGCSISGLYGIMDKVKHRKTGTGRLTVVLVGSDDAEATLQFVVDPCW